MMFPVHIMWLLALGGVVLLCVNAVIGVLITRPPAPPVGLPAGPPPPTPPSHEKPRDILARRFASGEIRAEEYERARDLLGGGGAKS